MSAPPALPAPIVGQQQVVYHVYQMGAPDAGINFNTGTLNWRKWLKPVLFFFLFSVWVVYLAGVSYNQSNCNSGNFYANPWIVQLGTINLNSFDLGTGVFSGDADSADCVQYFALFWWSVWLQFIAVVLAILIFVFPCLKPYSLGNIYFFLMSSVLLFFQANQAFTVTYIQYYKGITSSGGTVAWKWWNGAALTAAGAIGSLIMNFILILWFSYIGTPVTTTPPPADEEEPAVDVKVTA